ncbi:oxaloacetate decarboxylase [Marinobacterium aestuarii]|uniref:Probable oxaloacetate decarboxylase gamma chain n=1 Tax=Marinobacterium aestuarii TaxID=1821621 RepID=A0A1A9EUV5_9GAMM|nr:OadG family protein [Marinobacterium aestuarii]ANG61627.1 oxaloacetate decarboxylase [Marinobacterium aestuarii]
MDNLLSEGLELMVFGMGFVFVFLTLLVFVTGLMSKIVTKYAPAPEIKPAKKRATAAGSASVSAPAANNDELVAVISAAVHKFRSN